jgi:hypothetical protein
MHPTHNMLQRFAVSAVRWLGLAAVACAGLATLVGSGGGGGGSEPPAALTVISTSPTNGATGVAVASTVSASFSENLAANPTFTVAGGGGAAVAGVVSRSGATATFTPAAALAFSTTYTASVSGGSGASGGTQSAATTWTFTTVVDPNTPPALTLGATALTFNAATGGGNPTAQTVAITNGGGGTLSGLTATVVSYGGGPTGWLQAPTLNGTTAPATLTLQALTGSLAAGTYTALVQITAGAGATGSPQQVLVTFNVAAPSAFTIAGTVDFESVPNDTATPGPGAGRLLYASKTNKPIRGATVQVVSTTAVPGVPAGTVLASGTTSSTGTYSLGLATAQPVIVRVRAEMLRQNQVSGGSWNFTVRDNTQGDTVYALDSAVFTPVAGANTQNLRALSGQVGASTTYTDPTRAAGPFAILDVVYDAKQKVLSASANATFPALQLMWSVNNQPASGNLAAGLIGTSFYTFTGGQHRIYILGFADNDTDEYDRPVVAHEFGHYYQSVFSRDDSIGGPHSGGDRLDMRVAFSEGWGNAWSGMALATQYYTDSAGTGQQSGFLLDLAAQPQTNKGWFNEGSVQYLMYQMHANASIGFTPIFNVLFGFGLGLPADGALSSIHYFAHKLKQAVPGQAAAIDALLATQSITVADAFGLTETNSGGLGSLVVPVYKQHTAGLNVPQNYCVTDAAASGGVEINKLGANAFIRIPLVAAASRTISVTATTSAQADPGFRIHAPNGTRSDFDQSGATTETATLNGVSAGTYVLVLFDYTLTRNQGASGSGTGQSCFNVTVQ